MRRHRSRKLFLAVVLGASIDMGFGSAAIALPEELTEEPVSLTLSVSGARIRERCSGAYEVVGGRPFAVTVRSSPLLLARVRFFVEALAADGTWSPLGTYERGFGAGKATYASTAASSGRIRIWAQPLATDPRAESRSPVATIISVTPSWTRYGDGGARLNVRFYHQQYRLTCEAATLRMAHNFHDPYSIDGDLQALRMIGIDRRQPRSGRWGNPNEAFVGAYNGRMMRTGYGVHYEPVAEGATRYDPCRPALAVAGLTAAQIAGYVNQGYPVIVWGAHRGVGGINRHVWRAWDGERITAWSVEHTWVVVGFHGRPWSPTRLIVHDPSVGANRSLTLSAFNSFTKYFRTGVVVRG